MPATEPLHADPRSQSIINSPHEEPLWHWTIDGNRAAGSMIDVARLHRRYQRTHALPAPHVGVHHPVTPRSTIMIFLSTPRIRCQPSHYLNTSPAIATQPSPDHGLISSTTTLSPHQTE